MKAPEQFCKTKIIRFFIMAYVFLTLTIFGVGSSLTSSYMQKKHKDEVSQILSDENTSSLDRFFFGMTTSQQRTFLVLGILFGIMSGFCFAAANRQQGDSR
ncbi:hypothetical protein COB11_08405 [Candidatus Aerophobetes bacterium]|uniref:Uncharacterized protein n=1 Tax=Aerophobetes bacterium TaxID=2030807 RepID=A0A2A4YAC5_UNCAE|nr:MAG: hypothetical protein COB11_08585 [Candidatus Aerophobetes bacterium]PCI91448.1 MAG: hypothetical protein COB11_08405 [Candidatus Aerophobetes bacterium]